MFSHRFNAAPAKPAVEGAPPKTPWLERILHALPRVLVPMFALYFMGFALLYAAFAAFEFIRPIIESGDILGGLVKGLHMGVVALPVYELGLIVHQEYKESEKPQNPITRIQRGIARFAGMVFVALVLESLILVIKYSQQDMAGLLYYPVAILVGAGFLLISLGVFARMTGSSEIRRRSENPADIGQR